MKIFCLTYAGGNACFYDDLEKHLPGCFELIKFEYAGHGTRHKESCYLTMGELVQDAYDGLLQNINNSEEYALMGYSMGSVAAVELLKIILCDNKIRRPDMVFLAAHEPETLINLAGFDIAESDEIVKERTLQFGAVPSELVNNSIFWRTYLPVYRADYSIIGKYRFEELDLKTDVPAAVFYSETDTPLCRMEKWKKYFAGECTFTRFDGDHFFIQNHVKEIADIITDKLKTDRLVAGI